jgi:serine protease Do
MRGPLAGAKVVFGLILGLTALLPAPVRAADPGFLGLEIQGLDERATAALGPDYTRGVLVKDVAVGEPGAIAGFRRGDFIVEFDGSKVGSFEDLLKLVAKTKADEKISVVVLRAGKKADLSLRTSARPPSWNVTSPVFHSYPDLGVTVVGVNDDARKQFMLPWGTIGLVVTAIDEKSPVASTLHAGDVIVSANLRDLWEPRHLTRQIDDARKEGRPSLMLLIYASSGYRYTVLPVK